MQNYSKPASRSASIAGGVKPSTVPVSYASNCQTPAKGGIKKSPKGFQGGVMPGKV